MRVLHRRGEKPSPGTFDVLHFESAELWPLPAGRQLSNVATVRAKSKVKSRGSPEEEVEKVKEASTSFCSKVENQERTRKQGKVR